MNNTFKVFINYNQITIIPQQIFQYQKKKLIKYIFINLI